MIRDDLYRELARIITIQEAVVILRTVGFPQHHMPPPELNGRLFWAHIRNRLDAGVMVDGEPSLVRLVREEYPGNPVFQQAERDLRELGDQNGSTPPAAEQRQQREQREQREQPEPSPSGPSRQEAPPPRQEVYPTLVFVGSGEFGGYEAAVRELDPQAQLFYVSRGEDAEVGQVAVGVTRELPPDRIEELRRRLVAAGAGEDLEIHQAVFDHRPHLMETLRVRGPDQGSFVLEGVPSITPVRDIAAAILGSYGTQGTMSRRRHTVVDHVQPDGGLRRLDLDQPLHAAGVRDGHTLNVYWESIAGVGDLRVQAVMRVREEIHQYAAEHEDFEIVHMDDPGFPTEYEIQFAAHGLRLPEGAAVPAIPPPVPQDVHNVLILLGADFPLRAPAAVWLSPVFHPNILPAYHEKAPPEAEGLVCLGLLKEGYRPTLDFRLICQMLVEIAGYHNYEVYDINEGGVGFFNPLAAAWARSPEGQDMIISIGGKPLKDVLEEAVAAKGLRHRALRRRRSDGTADGA